MKQPTSRILYNYWNDVRGKRLAPTRLEIEPARMGAVLSETFILERASALSYPFRLAGTRVSEYFGMALRGTDFAALAGDEPHRLLKVMQAVTAQGATAVFEFGAETDDGRTASFEAIVLPLLHPTDQVTRYLGALSAIDPPAWLGTEAVEPTGLIAHETVWPDGRPHGLLDCNDRQEPFIPELAAARIVRFHRRQFRILDGGRKS